MGNAIIKYDDSPTLLNVSYDASTKTLDFPASAENEKNLGIYAMVGDTVAFQFYFAGYLDEMPLMAIAKIESVNASEDGVSVKLTTKWIKTEGKYARREVRMLFDKVKSGEWHVRMTALSDVVQDVPFSNELNGMHWLQAAGADFYYELFSLGVEIEVRGNNIKLKPKRKRLLTYNKKEKSIGSVLSSEVMAEIGKKLAEEEEDVKNVKLVVRIRMKDGTELAMSVRSLEKDGDGWIAKIKGDKNTLNYVKSANIDRIAALYVPSWARGHFVLS
jgi:hypothetical protein